MSNRATLHNLTSLIVNLLIVYVAYGLCRVLFVLGNLDLYPDMTFLRGLKFLLSGLIFDSSAIFWTNALVILAFLLPFHFKERRKYYQVVRWIYVVINALCVAANLCDIVYFRFTSKRTTASVFAEFANEGVGNLANVFADQFMRHWWLVLIFALIVAAFWFGYRSPLKPIFSNKPRKASVNQPNLKIYYGAGILVFAVVGYVSIGMIRGGFTRAVRPITISNANQYADNPAEAAIVLNTPFSMIRTLGKRQMTVPDYMPEQEADATYMPLVTPTVPADSLNAEGYNVVILIVESFSKQHIGFYNAEHNENGTSGEKVSFTPFIDSLLRDKALTFRYSYSNGRKSIDAMPSVLSSIPSFVEPFFLTPASMNDISGIARELTENKGYTSSFFHGAENGSMGFEAFANSSGFQKYYGRNEYKADKNYGGDRDFDGTWAIYDEEFMQFFADRLSEMPQPFVSALFTATSHVPYKIPERYDGVFPEGKDPIQRCVAYTDNALRLFFDKASKQPWFDRTIFVITADHSSGEVDSYYRSVLGHFAVPIVFYSPGIPSLKGYNETSIAQQTDIMPTLLSLLGYDRPVVAFGKDLINTPPEKTWAIHWLPADLSYEYLCGDYLLRFDGEKMTSAYRYRTDILQKENVLATMPDSLKVAYSTHLKAVIQQYMKAMNENTLTGKNYLEKHPEP